MSDERKIDYDGLQDNSFFSDAKGLLDSGKALLNKIDIDASRLSGETAIQAFIGHTDILRKCISTQGEESFLLLFENTEKFLQTIGVTFSDTDKKIANEVKGC